MLGLWIVYIQAAETISAVHHTCICFLHTCCDSNHVSVGVLSSTAMCSCILATGDLNDSIVPAAAGMNVAQFTTQMCKRRGAWFSHSVRALLRMLRGLSALSPTLISVCLASRRLPCLTGLDDYPVTPK